MTTQEGAARPSATDIGVHNVPNQSNYEVRVAEVPAGHAYYSLDNDRVIFTHTEVDPIWAGKGVGSALAQGALDDVRATGRHAIPLCPFIVAYLRRHPEYADVVDENYQHVFAPTG